MTDQEVMQLPASKESVELILAKGRDIAEGKVSPDDTVLQMTLVTKLHEIVMGNPEINSWFMNEYPRTAETFSFSAL